jgi:DNA-directed RNA polymerase specialized sigma24 family protein
MTAMHKQNVSFPSTMWTDMAQWNKASDVEKREVLDRFYVRYRTPLVCFIRARGYDADEAEDLLHDFVLEHQAGRLFVAADPARGRFRNLLMTSLKNFLVSRHRTGLTERRAPESGFVFLDSETVHGVRLEELLSGSRTPEELYERAWLLALLVNAVKRLSDEYERKGQRRHFVLFERRILLPILEGSDKPGIADLADELGLSPDEASNSLVTAKRGYERHLREEIRGYAASDKEVSEEINDFLHFLQNLRS